MNGTQVIQLINILWRMYEMYKRSMTMTKGVCIGVLAGAAVAVVGTQMMKDKKHLKKKTPTRPCTRWENSSATWKGCLKDNPEKKRQGCRKSFPRRP